MEQSNEEARPSDGDGYGAKAVFEDQVPADDPGDQLAEGGIGVGVGAAGHGDHRHHFGVAEAREGAADAGDNKGKDDRGPGVLGGGVAGEHEDAGAEDGAYA